MLRNFIAMKNCVTSYLIFNKLVLNRVVHIKNTSRCTYKTGGVFSKVTWITPRLEQPPS